MTHRIIVPFPTQSVAGWAAPNSLRAILAPELENWLQSMLGDPSKIRWGFEANGRRTMRNLADAQISAIDLVWTAENWARRSDGLADAEGLKRIMGATEGLTALEPDFRLVLARNDLMPEIGAGDLTVSDIAEMCLRLGRVIRTARSVEPRDVDATGTQDFGAGASEIVQSRLISAAAAVTAAAADLEAMAASNGAGPGALNDDLARRALRAAILAQSIGAATDNTDRYRQNAAHLRATADKVVTALAPLGTPDLADLVATLAGRDFPVFRPFDLSAAAHAALALSGAGLDAGVSQSERRSWLQQVARVIPEVGDLELALIIGEATTGVEPGIRLAQLPWIDGDAWIGGPLDGTQIAALTATTSLVMPATAALQPPTGFCGLSLGPIIDRIPAVKQTAGIALPFDQPSARAPQVALLVVPPDAEAIAALPAGTDPGPWDWAHIRGALDQVIEETRLRAADPNYLQGLGLALPSTFIPFSSISTVFDNDLAAEAQLATEQ